MHWKDLIGRLRVSSDVDVALHVRLGLGAIIAERGEKELAVDLVQAEETSWCAGWPFKDADGIRATSSDWTAFQVSARVLVRQLTV